MARLRAAAVVPEKQASDAKCVRSAGERSSSPGTRRRPASTDRRPRQRHGPSIDVVSLVSPCPGRGQGRGLSGSGRRRRCSGRRFRRPPAPCRGAVRRWLPAAPASDGGRGGPRRAGRSGSADNPRSASPFAGRLAAMACDGLRQLPGERCHLWHAALADNPRRLGRTAEAPGGLELVAAFGRPGSSRSTAAGSASRPPRPPARSSGYGTTTRD